MPPPPADLRKRLPAAVLWDMDGTLIDTEPYWMAAERELVEAYGGEWSQADAEAVIGNSLLTSARILQSRGVPLPAEEIIDFLIDRVAAEVRREVPWQPGARQLLDALHAAGVPTALVTMSYRRLAEPVAEQAGVFDVLVTGDMVAQGKPHPESYLRAAETLGVDPRDCVAFEDSPPGIRAARASGAVTVGVQHIVPVEPQPGLSRVTSLADLTLGDIAAIADGQVLDLLGTA